MKPVEIDVKLEYKPSFRKHVGCGGVGLMLAAICIGCTHVYIAYLYTVRFSVLTREHVWPFFTLGAGSVSLVGYHLLCWKTFAKDIEVANPEEDVTIFQKIKRIKAMFDMNGELFLWKLYALEITEAAMQMYNLVVLYTCTLPVPVVCTLCAGLAIDNIFCAYGAVKPNTPTRRNRQVRVDLAVDIACSALPLLFLWFARFQIKI